MNSAQNLSKLNGTLSRKTAPIETMLSVIFEWYRYVSVSDGYMIIWNEFKIKTALLLNIDSD